MWSFVEHVFLAETTVHYCGMYVLLSDDKHRFVRDSSLCALEILDNVRDNFFSDNFFFQQILSPSKNLFLGLNFVQSLY